MSVLQREEELESNVYNGDKTVNVIMNDIQPKDIIEYDFSIIGDNPIFQNKFFYSFYLNGYYDSKELYFRIIKPKHVNLNINYLNDSASCEKIINSSKEELIWHLKDVPGLESESGSPSWYDPYTKVELSEYSSWSEVINWGKKVFKLNFSSKITDHPKVKEIDSLTSDEEKITKALDFVQNDIRYFGIEIGSNSHQPKDPAKILKDGYGDCKDKTSLFCEILRSAGIEAYPVLVHTETRFGLLNAIPSPSQFNHVITMVKLKGKEFFLDPTGTSQAGNIKNIYLPNYGYGLVLKDSVTELTYLSSKRISDLTLKEYFTVLDISGKTNLHVKTIYSGYEADVVRYKYANSNLKDIQDKYEEFYESKFKNVTQQGQLAFKDDRNANIFTTTENYKIKRMWTEGSNDILELNVGGHFIKEALDEIDLSLETRKSPLFLDFPNRKVHIVEVQLPENWDLTFETNKINNRYVWYSRKLTYANRKLKIEYTFHILRKQVEPLDYPSFKEDIENIYNDLGYVITINQKVNANTKNSNINWLVVFLAFLISIITGFAARYFYKRLTLVEGSGVPMRFGGWLILPMLGLTLNILLIFFGLFTNNFFNKTVWILQTDETSSNYIAGFSGVLIYELSVNILLLSYTILLLALAIKYNRYVPKLFIVYYVSYFILTTGDDLLVYMIMNNSSDIIKNIFRHSITCAIWIPYFLVSKRVKETFIL